MTAGRESAEMGQNGGNGAISGLVLGLRADIDVSWLVLFAPETLGTVQQKKKGERRSAPPK
jgi:hypothetical protein